MNAVPWAFEPTFRYECCACHDNGWTGKCCCIWTKESSYVAARFPKEQVHDLPAPHDAPKARP